MTILDELYNGNISPAESAVPDSEEYREMLQEKNRIVEELKKAVPTEKLPLVDKLTSLFMSITEEECRCLYAEGVRFGINLMTEVKQMKDSHPPVLPMINK